MLAGCRKIGISDPKRVSNLDLDQLQYSCDWGKIRARCEKSPTERPLRRYHTRSLDPKNQSITAPSTRLGLGPAGNNGEVTCPSISRTVFVVEPVVHHRHRHLPIFRSLATTLLFYS
ncbi:hypothetical protein RSAG8_05423, partial [Rhizoctonia solani AG-8 WAC10335]